MQPPVYHDIGFFEPSRDVAEDTERQSLGYGDYVALSCDRLAKRP